MQAFNGQGRLSYQSAPHGRSGPTICHQQVRHGGRCAPFEETETSGLFGTAAGVNGRKHRLHMDPEDMAVPVRALILCGLTILLLVAGVAVRLVLHAPASMVLSSADPTTVNTFAPQQLTTSPMPATEQHLTRAAVAFLSTQNSPPSPSTSSENSGDAGMHLTTNKMFNPGTGTSAPGVLVFGRAYEPNPVADDLGHFGFAPRPPPPPPLPPPPVPIHQEMKEAYDSTQLKHPLPFLALTTASQQTRTHVALSPPSPRPPPQRPPPPSPHPPHPPGCALWCTESKGHCNWAQHSAQCECATCAFCREKAEAELRGDQGKTLCPQYDDLSASRAAALELAERKQKELERFLQTHRPPPPPPSPCVLPQLGQDEYVQVRGRQLWRGGTRFRFVGMNLWYAAWLGAPSGGDQARLERELDTLRGLGVTSVRILALAEGPDLLQLGCADWCNPHHDHCRWGLITSHCDCAGCDFCHEKQLETGPAGIVEACPKLRVSGRIIPATQPSPGVFNLDVSAGLDFALAALAARGMNAVLILSNMWAWSGGFAAYVSWAIGEPAPPMQAGATDSDWQAHQNFATRFYDTQKATEKYFAAVRKLLTRRNTVNGRLYRQDPAIMSWQLANEPRPLLKIKAYRAWIKKSSEIIRAIDCAHLVSLGSEGPTPWPEYVHNDIEQDHEHVDYVTIHVWPQNWAWYDPKEESENRNVQFAWVQSRDYMSSAIAAAAAIDKPLIVEEFGMARDGGSFAAEATTGRRDDFYLRMCHFLADAADGVAGLNFWAWGGEGRPRNAGEAWAVGDAWTGDPPHELQGWYSIFSTDASTMSTIGLCAKLFDDSTHSSR